MRMDRRDDRGSEFQEKIVSLNRVAKVVKGGRRFSFSALVVVGDGKGRVGAGLGKAGEVPDAIRKGVDDAKKHMITVPMVGTTIPHEVRYKLGAAKVMLKPGVPGTGVISGSSMRAVVEAAGIKDILTKSLGTDNPINVVRATVSALASLRTLASVAELRGRTPEEIVGSRKMADRMLGRTPAAAEPAGGGRHAMTTRARDLPQERDRLRARPEGNARRPRSAQAQPHGRARGHRLDSRDGAQGAPPGQRRRTAGRHAGRRRPAPAPRRRRGDRIVKLHELTPAKGSHRPRKRVGRGMGAGQGKTSGRGQKGQGSRSSVGLPVGFEGGQMPLKQRLPKLRGFHNHWRREYVVVNLGKLGRFEAGAVVDPDVLTEAGLIPRASSPVKVLAAGELGHALTLRVHRISVAARAAVEAAGGTVELLERPRRRGTARGRRRGCSE